VAELTKLASAKKIAPGDFHEICRTLKKVKSLRLFFFACIA
jgi:cytoskeleton-associated protein 5